MLAAFLDTGAGSRATARRLLREPWCWPTDRPEARELAETPAPPRPGATLLAAVHPATGAASLWALEPEPPRPGTEDRSLSDAASRTLARMRRRALRDVLLVGDADPARRAPGWRARLLHLPPGCGMPGVLEGPSFGLAMGLAQASWHLAVPVPADLCALGCVGPDGPVRRVEGLPAKLRALAEVALGVRRVLVAAGQADEARAAADAHRLQVVAVPDLAAALAVGWPTLETILHERWSQPGAASRAASALYRMTVLGRTSLTGWEAVARSAETLVDLLAGTAEPEEVQARDRARTAALIARRHEGAGAPPWWPEPEELDALPRPLRLQVLAQAVQTAADHDDASATAWAARAARWVPADARERYPEHLALLGAIGRARAAGGDYGGAARDLRTAVEGWAALFEPAEGSRALCELLRVLGILGEHDAVRDLQRAVVADALQAPATTDTSRAFLALALGRAHAQCAAWSEALAHLEDPDIHWDEDAPDHALRSRLRWLAVVQDALGRPDDATRTRERLLAVDDDYAFLARLDRALHRGEPTGALLAAVRHRTEDPFREVHRLLDRWPDAPDLDRNVARHFRY